MENPHHGPLLLPAVRDGHEDSSVSAPFPLSYPQADLKADRVCPSGQRDDHLITGLQHMIPADRLPDCILQFLHSMFISVSVLLT